MDKRIGAQYYTIRDYCQDIESFDKACKKIIDIGFKTIQLSGIGDFEAKDIKNILDKYNLSVVCTHRPPQNYIENIEKEIEFHKTLNCKICGIGAMPGFKADTDTIDAFLKNFTPVCQKLKENGLIFAYHNHALEFERIGTEYAFDILINKFNCDNFKLILDVYWLAYAGINPARFIKEHKEKIACVHLKDMRIENHTQLFAELGCGNLDLDDIISACEKSDAEFMLIEQDNNWMDNNPFKSLEISYKYMLGKGYN